MCVCVFLLFLLKAHTVAIIQSSVEVEYLTSLYTGFGKLIHRSTRPGNPSFKYGQIIQVGTKLLLRVHFEIQDSRMIRSSTRFTKEWKRKGKRGVSINGFLTEAQD